MIFISFISFIFCNSFLTPEPKPGMQLLVFIDWLARRWFLSRFFLFNLRKASSNNCRAIETHSGTVTTSHQSQRWGKLQNWTRDKLIFPPQTFKTQIVNWMCKQLMTLSAASCFYRAFEFFFFVSEWGFCHGRRTRLVITLWSSLPFASLKQTSIKSESFFLSHQPQMSRTAWGESHANQPISRFVRLSTAFELNCDWCRWRFSHE